MPYRKGNFKFIIIACIFSFFFYSYESKAQLKLPDGDHQIMFRWMDETSQVAEKEYTAMLIPVRLSHCPEQFYMQFDLGSPFSLFYRNKLKEIQLRYPKVKMVEDSSVRLMDFSFTAGSVVIEAKEIIVRQYNDQKIDWNNEKSLKIIGTIGMDLIAGKVLVINYPEKKLFIHTAVPDSIRERIKLSDLVVAGNSLLMPAVIRGKSHLLFFDTGSSAFELITDKTNYTELAVTNALPVEKKVRSWDRILTAHTIATNDSITIAQTRLPLHRVTYMEGASSSQVEQMKKIGIGGMTGNKLFLNSILILDTKGKQFGLLQTR